MKTHSCYAITLIAKWCHVKKLKISKTMSVLHSFVWNHVKYPNMEGFHRDSHIKLYINYTHIAICM